jgi:hypothetical protein
MQTPCGLCGLQNDILNLEDENDSNTYGWRAFCSACGVDYMSYSGNSINVPPTLLNYTLQNITANRWRVACVLSQELRWVKSISWLISQYSWFTLPCVSFLHLPTFPRAHQDTSCRGEHDDMRVVCLPADDLQFLDTFNIATHGYHEETFYCIQIDPKA